MKDFFTRGKRDALLMGIFTLLLCLVLGDGLLGMVSYRDDPTMRALVVLPGIAVFLVGLFLPPWLFRKTVHKRDTFWNLPLYFLAFFLLRSFFQDRVFLTQHYFLRPYISGFLYIPGDKLLAPVLAVALMWGAGWFMLSNLSLAEDPRNIRLERKRAKEQMPKKELTKEEQAKRRKRWLLSGVALVIFCLGAWITASVWVYQNKDMIEQKIQEAYGLNRRIELRFGKNGANTPTIRGHMGFAFGKQYDYIQVTFFLPGKSHSSQNISVTAYERTTDGEFVLSQGVYRETADGFVSIYETNTADFLDGVIFRPTISNGDGNKHFDLQFANSDPAVQSVPCRITGMPKEFFDEDVTPFNILFSFF